MKNLLKAALCLFILVSIAPEISRADNPKDIDETMTSITEAATNKDFKEVMQLFASVIDQPSLSSSQRAQVYYLRGWSYHKISNEYLLAIADYSYAIDLKADDKWTFSSLVNRAGCYLELKEYDKAIEDVESALEIWPDHPVALNKKQLILSSMPSNSEESKNAF